MIRNYAKILLVAVFAMALGSLTANAQMVITQWDFENENLTPSTGSGTAQLIGGTEASWVTGNPGRGWNTANYPAQGTGSGTAGAQFNVSTAGFNNITVEWDNRHSNTGANRIRLQYTLDGEEWINFEASEENATNFKAGVEIGFDDGRYIADTGTVWYDRSADLSEISGAGNNPDFAVRFVTEFVDGVNYGASTPTASYNISGTIRFDNVTVSGLAGNSPMIFANPSNISGFTYVVGSGPSNVLTTVITGGNLTPESDDITIAAPESFEISLDGTTYTGSITLPYSGGTIPETTLSIRMKGGLAAGNYSETINISGAGAPDLNILVSGSVSTGVEPELSSVILPMFIEGQIVDDAGTNNNPNRLPFAYHATLSNLTPNATYRYYNRVVLSTEAPDAGGAGNIIIVNPTDKTFTRLTSPSFATDGAYGEFTTNAEGEFSGWFMTEPTANSSRFKPGNELFMRIILNDGNGGTQPETWLTSEQSVKVIKFGTAATDTTGTAVVGMSDFTAKNFVFIYDNAEGTGRPLYGTHIESSATDFFTTTNRYAPFFATDVVGQAGRWGAIVPNNNANGVVRVDERNITDGSIVNQHTSADGTWNGVDTKNPTGGLETVLVINTMVGLPEISDAVGKIYSYNNIMNIEFAKETTASIQIINLQGGLVNEFVMSGLKVSKWLNVPAGIYVIKITTTEGTFSKKLYIR